MFMKNKYLIIGILLLGITLALAACAAPECPECPEVECPDTECPECPEAECPAVECPECPACPECPEPESALPGIEAAWSSSGHADSEAEAFRHWDEDDPAVVSTSCSKCHSTQGNIEFNTTGETTTEFPAEEVMGIECVACHNPAAIAKTSVVMPSGIELMGLGDEARCMECHQGRHSAVSLNTSIAEAAGIEVDAAAEDPVAAAAAAADQADPDIVYEDLGFANIHYYAAAATKYGTLAKGGGEYSGKTYDGNFAHVEEFDTCIECHSPHTLEVQGEGCVECHGEGEYQDYRMLASAVDYDGDGDIEEGIYYEIEGLKEILFAELSANGLVYDAASYPYFFDEAGERFAAWTPRLLRAAYNYQVSMKDPGGFAHGGKYTIQLLYDSIEDLGGDVSTLNRDDHGHFQGSAEAFRHWDEDGEVSASCARCHSATGLPTYHKEGVNVTAEISNGFQCVTCHSEEEWPARYVFAEVNFPSGATVAVAEGDEGGLCMQCHQGRASGADVDRVAGDTAADALIEGGRFINIHYFPAGATRYGADAAPGYQFEGQEYLGYFEHVAGFQNCTDCHDAHALEVKTDQCFTCHAGVESLHDIRISAEDFDGDGDATEGLAGEIETLSEALYQAMQAYTAANDATEGIVYNSHSYPYFFTDTNGNGVADSDESNYGNRYVTWTPNLLAAAYNYQYSQKDPGAYAHNGKYMIQLVIDSIQAVGGDVSTYTRP
jgi:hypothetical protein